MLIQFFSEKCRRFYAPACGKSQFPAIFLDLIFARQMRRLSGPAHHAPRGIREGSAIQEGCSVRSIPISGVRCPNNGSKSAFLHVSRLSYGVPLVRPRKVRSKAASYLRLGRNRKGMPRGQRHLRWRDDVTRHVSASESRYSHDPARDQNVKGRTTLDRTPTHTVADSRMNRNDRSWKHRSWHVTLRAPWRSMCDANAMQGA